MTALIEITPYESSAADQVAELWRNCLPSNKPWNDPVEVLCRKCNYNDRLFFVAKIENRIVATVMGGYDGVRGWIYSLAVAEDVRRQGIGHRMLKKMEKSLLDRGCPKINLQVLATNRQVVGFYVKCGYAIEERASLAKVVRPDSGTILDPVPTIRVDASITLSQIRRADKPAYIKHLNRSDSIHQNCASIPYPYRNIDADQWLSKVVHESHSYNRCRNWAIRNPDGNLIGTIGLFNIEPNHQAEIGYWLAEEYWGRGIATSATRAVTLHAFVEMNLAKVYAKVFCTNPASARVLEKAGFAREGTLRNHFLRKDEALDVHWYGRLRHSS